MWKYYIASIFILITIITTPIEPRAETSSYDYVVINSFPTVLAEIPYKPIIVLVEFIQFKNDGKIQRTVYVMIPNNGRSTLGDRGFPIEILDWRGLFYESKTIYKMEMKQVHYLLEKIRK